MKKAIIHIGAHKTGSTSLQKFFFEHHDLFKNTINLIYPIDITGPEFGFWGHHYLSWYFTPPYQMPISLEQLNVVIESYFEKLLHLRGDKFNLLISSEDFTWNQQIDKFTKMLRDSGFSEIIMVMYVRKQHDAAVSLYQTGVKSGLIEDFTEWFTKSKHIFNYYEIAEKWKQVSDEVVVRLYDRKLLLEGDIIKDFLNWLSFKLGTEIKFPQDYKNESYELNLSMPDFITLMLQYYNRMPNNHQVIKYLKKAAGLFEEQSLKLPKYDFIPPSLKRKVLEDFKESNRLLCEKYLGKEHINFFEDVEFGSDKEWQERFGYPGSQLVELIKAFLEIIKNITKTQ